MAKTDWKAEAKALKKKVKKLKARLTEGGATKAAKPNAGKSAMGLPGGAGPVLAGARRRISQLTASLAVLRPPAGLKPIW